MKKIKLKKPGVLFVVFLMLISVMLTWFFVTAEDYYDYAGNTIESSARVAPVTKEDAAAQTIPVKRGFNTEVKYRRFFITAPGAEKVELLADFNRWGEDPIELKKYRKGYFETSVALTAGDYKYLFSIDGKETLDPSNKDRIMLGDREVCIKTVR